MSNRNIELGHFLKVMLIVLLLLAVWHTTTHDLDISNDLSGHTECQVCRLNHVPVDDLPLLTWLVSPLLIIFIFNISTHQCTTHSYHYTLGARAPPLY